MPVRAGTVAVNEADVLVVEAPLIPSKRASPWTTQKLNQVIRKEKRRRLENDLAPIHARSLYCGSRDGENEASSPDDGPGDLDQAVSMDESGDLTSTYSTQLNPGNEDNSQKDVIMIEGEIVTDDEICYGAVSCFELFSVDLD